MAASASETPVLEGSDAKLKKRELEKTGAVKVVFQVAVFMQGDLQKLTQKIFYYEKLVPGFESFCTKISISLKNFLFSLKDEAEMSSADLLPKCPFSQV